MEQLLFSPEDTIKQALTKKQDYVAPTEKSAVQNSESSSINNTVKNIVAVTACPTGVAHTFMSAEAITKYAQAKGWNVKVETRGQGGLKIYFQLKILLLRI